MRLNLVPRFCRLILISSYALLAFGAALLALRFPVLLFLVVGYAIWRSLHRWKGSEDSHGSARLANFADIARNGLLASSGLIMGRANLVPPPTRHQAIRGLFDPSIRSEDACRMFSAAFHSKRRGVDSFIRIKKYVHLATFAPAGAGKSVSVLVPNLLSFVGNCVITDPKGELYRLTGEHRRRKLKHQVVRFDPMGVCGAGSASFNPLDFIDENAPDFFDQCRALANLLVMRVGTEKDPHWNDSCEIIICSTIAFVCAFEQDRSQRNLLIVKSILASRERYLRTVETMRKVQGFGGIVSELGKALDWYSGDELNSIFTTVTRQLQFLNSPLVAAHVSTSSFDPKLLRSGRRVTLFLCLPPTMLVTLAPLQRMWIGSILRIVTHNRQDERDSVLFLIDEAAHLGKCQALEDAVTLMRGMGIRLWFFFQSQGQLKTCFGENADVILDNLGTQQYFGTKSFEVAEAISKRIGEQTITVSSRDRSSSTSRPTGGFGKPPESGSVSTSTSYSHSNIARQVLKPEEVLTLPSDVGLVFHRNLPVIPVRLIEYFSTPEFRGGRSGNKRPVGLASLGQAVFLLLLTSFFAALAIGSFTLSETHLGVAAPAWSAFRLPASLAPTPEKIEAERLAAIDAANQAAHQKRVAHTKLSDRNVPVPRYLSKRVIESEREESILHANLLAERRLQSYRSSQSGR